jgi:putative component of membrane protein insertase Oxa1/YidC/SpoIIIJ protein YidD
MTRRPGFRERLALSAIRGYQRFLSPYKGFSCALRVATGGDSCSAYGYRAIRRGGLQVGLRLLRQRMHLCGHVHRRPAAARHPLLHAQRGHCDLSCDVPTDCSCDVPASLDFAGDTLGTCTDCSAPWDMWREFRDRRGRRRITTAQSAELDALAERVRQRARRDTN